MFSGGIERDSGIKWVNKKRKIKELPSPKSMIVTRPCLKRKTPLSSSNLGSSIFQK